MCITTAVIEEFFFHSDDLLPSFIGKGEKKEDKERRKERSDRSISRELKMF